MPNGKNKGNKGKNGKKPGNFFIRPTIWGNLTSTVLIFLIILSLYSLISDYESKTVPVSLSQVASDIQSGKVASIDVRGDELTVTYTDKTVKESKKESGLGLTETLKNYQIPAEKLALINIDVKGPSGLSFWFATLAPFILPLAFIIFFIWFLTRQVKGAGMQAFTFGQSRARIINPEDKGQKITFKDVAGVKEAKEELTEIVDFLKNPKKFLDIGARIPKGILLMGAPGTG